MIADAGGDSAPGEAHEYVQKAIELANGPVLGRLENASDDLYAWAAARLARNSNLPFLAAEATAILEAVSGQRAGSSGNLQVQEMVWS